MSNVKRGDSWADPGVARTAAIVGVLAGGLWLLVPGEPEAWIGTYMAGALVLVTALEQRDPENASWAALLQILAVVAPALAWRGLDAPLGWSLAGGLIASLGLALARLRSFARAATSDATVSDATVLHTAVEDRPSLRTAVGLIVGGWGLFAVLSGFALTGIPRVIVIALFLGVGVAHVRSRVRVEQMLRDGRLVIRQPE